VRLVLTTLNLSACIFSDFYHHKLQTQIGSTLSERISWVCVCGAVVKIFIEHWKEHIIETIKKPTALSRTKIFTQLTFHYTPFSSISNFISNTKIQVWVIYCPNRDNEKKNFFFYSRREISFFFHWRSTFKFWKLCLCSRSNRNFSHR